MENLDKLIALKKEELKKVQSEFYFKITTLEADLRSLYDEKIKTVVLDETLIDKRCQIRWNNRTGVIKSVRISRKNCNLICNIELDTIHFPEIQEHALKDIIVESEEFQILSNPK